MTDNEQAALAMVNELLAKESVPTSARVMHYDAWTHEDGTTYDAQTVIEIRFGKPFTNLVTLDDGIFDLATSDPKAFRDVVGDTIWHGLRTHASELPMMAAVPK